MRMKLRIAAAGAGVGIVGLAALGVGVLALSGGSEDAGAARAAAVQQAANSNNGGLLKVSASTSSSTTVQFDATATVKGTPMGDVTITATGAADFPKSMAQVTGQAMGLAFTAVTDGNDVYVQSLILGGDWYSVDTQGHGTAALFSQPFTDPATAFALIRDSSDNVETVGQETVRGVATMHYKATVNAAKAAAVVGAGVQPSKAGKLSDLGLSTAPVDVWVDGQGRIAQLSFAYAGSGASSSSSGFASGGTLTLNFTNYGQPVNVTIPPASSVKPLSESVIGGLLGGKHP